METMLDNIPGVVIYLDHILISSSTEDQHNKSLRETSVEFLGHLVDGQGLRPLPEKTRAVQEAPTLTNVTELKAYLGLISYYGKFLPNLSTHLASLYKL